MATDTTPAGAMPAGGATPPVSGPADQAAPADATSGDDQLGTAGRSALEAERKSRREAEKRAEKAEKALADRSAQDLSETEKLRAQLAEHERREADHVRERQETRVRETAMNVAASLGFRKPGDAYRFMDLAAVEYDEDGAPTNVEPLLRDLLSEYPGLAAVGQVVGTSDAGRRSPSGTDTPDMNDLLRAAAGKG